MISISVSLFRFYPPFLLFSKSLFVSAGKWKRWFVLSEAATVDLMEGAWVSGCSHPKPKFNVCLFLFSHTGIFLLFELRIMEIEKQNLFGGSHKKQGYDDDQSLISATAYPQLSPSLVLVCIKLALVAF